VFGRKKFDAKYNGRFSVTQRATLNNTIFIEVSSIFDPVWKP